MPAPHRRNVGALLAGTIATARHTDNVSRAGDRHVASRERHAAKWEEANKRLTGPALEREAEEYRIGHERSRRLYWFGKQVEAGQAKPPPASLRVASPESVVVPGRYAIECVGCWSTIRLHSLRPRVPLCEHCRERRQKAKLARRRRSALSSRSDAL